MFNPDTNDDDPGIFDQTSELYEKDFEDTHDPQNAARHQWRDLQLSWQDHPWLSHYSHGDAGGVGMPSNLQRRLGLPVQHLVCRAPLPRGERGCDVPNDGEQEPAADYSGIPVQYWEKRWMEIAFDGYNKHLQRTRPAYGGGYGYLHFRDSQE